MLCWDHICISSGAVGCHKAEERCAWPLRKEGELVLTALCGVLSFPAYGEVRQAAVVHRHHGRHAPSLPAGRAELAEVFLGPRDRYNPG